jgi:nucleotide-binding universal stress UspA family protein
MVQHILVTLDGSAIAEQALPHAAMLARLLGARLTLARVPETMVVPVASAGIWITRETEPHEARAHAEAYLAEVATRAELGGLDVQVALPQHPVVSGLVEAIAATGADLVVLTTHGHSGITHMLLGSVASKLVQHAHAPVYVVPARESPGGPPRLGTLVVPLDGSANGELALPVTADLARRAGAAIRLVRVPTVPAYLTVFADTAAMIPAHLQQRAIEAEGYLSDVAAGLAGQGLNVAADVEMALEGGVEKVVVDYATAQHADLILLCSHGQSGISRMIMGSIADRILRLSECAVWVVRPEGTSD